MIREAFLARVRQSATRGRPYRVHLEAVGPDVGYVGATGDLCDALAREIALVGGESQVVDSWAAAREVVRQWLQLYGARSAVCWQHETLSRLGLSELLSAEGIVAHAFDQLASMPLEQQRQIVLSADVGISSTDFAIAETGTLAVCAGPGRERMISLVPPVHMAIVDREQILPDLYDLFTKLADRDLRALPSNVTLISGPSKTGDIELELTTGVHGPGKWHVVIVR